MRKVLLVDNYDSFTYNLVHYLIEAGVEVEVRRNDQLGSQEEWLQFDAYVISPGPCSPVESGNLMAFLAAVLEKKSVLGICLGHQAIGLHYGYEVVKAKLPVHGKSSQIAHSGKGIFEGIASPMEVGRYHSLIISGNGKMYEPIAVHEGEIMAATYSEKKVFGVQFHPESILTPEGKKLIRNWVNQIG